MKIIVQPGNYTFNASSKTITFSTQVPPNLESILHITNVTRGVLYFQPQAGINYSASYSSPVLTLNASTTGHSNSDTLEIFYDDNSKALTNAELRASAVDVSASSLPLPSGAATETTLSTLNTKIPSLGQTTMAQASPVVIASDQSAIPASQSGTWNINNVSGTVSLPTGAATSANQVTTNNSLSSIDNKTPALDNSKQPVIPSMTTGGNISVTTAAIGTNWTAFGSQVLKQLTVSNQTGTNVEFRQGGAGVGFIVPAGAIFTFFGITNSNQIEARRTDTSNTQVTVTARWES